ncbi:MAG: glycosyltransferase [Candidatus Saccharibacteria bacterium]|nr:glycosyltransferase [Candidatus Saccharibacteria bacterium]
MNQQLSVILSEGTLAVFLIVAFILVVAANIYDIRLTLRRKSLGKMKTKFRRAHKSAITVLVYARNNADSIINCLESIRRNRYSRFDIVVINDLSMDNIGSVVRSYIQKHPRLPVRLYSKRKYTNKSEALLQGYRRSQKGDYVMVIDATNTIPTSLLRDSASRFWHDEKLDTLHFNVNNQTSDSLTLLYFRFVQLSRSMLDKFYTLVSEYRVVTNLSGSMYSLLAFKNACKSIAAAGKYDSDLIVFDSSVSDDKTAIIGQISKENSGIYYSVFAAVTVLLQTYSMYIAATLQSSLILIVGWLAAAFWLLLVTWSSRAIRTKDKITLSLCAPFIYFLIYVQFISHVFYVSANAISSVLKQIGHEFVVGAMAG